MNGPAGTFLLIDNILLFSEFDIKCIFFELFKIYFLMTANKNISSIGLYFSSSYRNKRSSGPQAYNKVARGKAISINKMIREQMDDCVIPLSLSR